MLLATASAVGANSAIGAIISTEPKPDIHLERACTFQIHSESGRVDAVNQKPGMSPNVSG